KRCQGGARQGAVGSDNVLDAAALAAASVDVEVFHVEIVDGLRGIAQRLAEGPRVAQHLAGRNVIPFLTGGTQVVDVQRGAAAHAVDGDRAVNVIEGALGKVDRIAADVDGVIAGAGVEGNRHIGYRALDIVNVLEAIVVAEEVAPEAVEGHAAGAGDDDARGGVRVLHNQSLAQLATE